jgi:hypothetical protein
VVNAAKSIIRLGYGPDEGGAAGGLAPAVFQHAIRDRHFAGDGQLRPMFLHAVSNAASARLDRTAHCLDVARAGTLQRTRFRKRKDRGENGGCGSEMELREHGSVSWWIYRSLTARI